jgi:type IV fimbrial biogenesis protein FimT
MTCNNAGPSSEMGFTILELLIVIALIAILLAIAAMSTGFLDQNRLPAASRQLYSDLQKIRQDALTKSTSNNSMGFGIILSSSNSYTTFEFNDSNTNFTYDGSAEQSGPNLRSLPSSITLTVSPPANSTLLYDKKGIARTTGWTPAGNTTFVLTSSASTQSRCVALDATSIREGIWNGTACNTQ